MSKALNCRNCENERNDLELVKKITLFQDRILIDWGKFEIRNQDQNMVEVLKNPRYDANTLGILQDEAKRCRYEKVQKFIQMSNEINDIWKNLIKEDEKGIRFENAFLQTKTYLFNLKEENKENAFRNEEMPVSLRPTSTNISSTSLPTPTPLKSMKQWVDRKLKNLKERITNATYQAATETPATTLAMSMSPLPPGAPTATAQTTTTYGPATTQVTSTTHGSTSTHVTAITYGPETTQVTTTTHGPATTQVTATHRPASTQATGTQALNSEATQARAPPPPPVPTTAKVTPLTPAPQFERFTKSVDSSAPDSTNTVATTADEMNGQSPLATTTTQATPTTPMPPPLPFLEPCKKGTGSSVAVSTNTKRNYLDDIRKGNFQLKSVKDTQDMIEGLLKNRRDKMVGSSEENSEENSEWNSES